MSEQPPLTADAVEVFIASLRQRSVPVNTIKSYASFVMKWSKQIRRWFPRHKQP